MGAEEFGLLSPVWAGTEVALATGDEALVAAMLRVEAAWVAVQADSRTSPATLASGAEAEAAARVTDVGRYDLPALAARVPAGANPLIPLLEDFRAEVAKEAGHPVAAVHRGATSQDIVDTALALLLRDAALITERHLFASARDLAVLALRHRDDIAIARSLTQHALPTTVGHRLARWAHALESAASRVREARALLPVQWGGAVGTLASLVDTLASQGAGGAGAGHRDAPQLARRLVAALAGRLELAFPELAWHTDRAPFLRLASALAESVAAAGKVARDVGLLTRPEVGELAEPHAPGRGGSSAMPHKRNPVFCVMISSAALEAPGHLASVFLAAGQAVDERPDGAWHAEWAALRSLARLAGGSAARLAELAGGLRVFPERSREVAGLFGEVILAERVAARLAPLLPGGRERIDELVRLSLSSGSGLRASLRAELDPTVLPDAALDALLDPTTYLGLAPSDVDRVVATLLKPGVAPSPEGTP